MEQEKMTREEHKARTDRSYKLLLLFAMLSMTMMFAGLTSAFVVSKSRPDWHKDFQMPSAFYVSTVLIILGSVTMHLAKKYIQKDQRAATTKMLWSTLLLGILFFVFQFLGYQQIIAQGFYFTGSASSITTTFLYVVTLTHLLHN